MAPSDKMKDATKQAQKAAARHKGDLKKAARRIEAEVRSDIRRARELAPQGKPTRPAR